VREYGSQQKTAEHDDDNEGDEWEAAAASRGVFS
jgi:hypothetical protein